jgi:hypothetical protein
MKEEYAIIDNNGNFITAPNETGSGNYISLMTKANAEMYAKMYGGEYKYKIKKIKVK